MYTVYYFKDLSETTGIRIMRNRLMVPISDGPTDSHEHEQRTDAVRVVCAAFFRVLRYVYFKFMFNNKVQTQEKSQSRFSQTGISAAHSGRALAQLLSIVL